MSNYIYGHLIFVERQLRFYLIILPKMFLSFLPPFHPLNPSGIHAPSKNSICKFCAKFACQSSSSLLCTMQCGPPSSSPFRSFIHIQQNGMLPLHVISFWVSFFIRSSIHPFSKFLFIRFGEPKRTDNLEGGWREAKAGNMN